jgi:hypothetical protein
LVDDLLDLARGHGLDIAVDNRLTSQVRERQTEGAAQLLDIGVAPTHHCGRIRIVGQRQQKVVEHCVRVAPLFGDRKRPVRCLFKLRRKATIGYPHVECRD